MYAHFLTDLTTDFTFKCIHSIGAGGPTRTGTQLPARDFKSLVSTIPPRRQILSLFNLAPSGEAVKRKLTFLLTILQHSEAAPHFPCCIRSVRTSAADAPNPHRKAHPAVRQS